MNVIEEIKKNLKLEIIKIEIRPDSEGKEYLEAVIDRKELESLKIILTKHLGPAAKEPGEKREFPREIQGLVDDLGGLRIEQSFFYKRIGTTVFYAALWPWESHRKKITLKVGTGKLQS